MRKHFEQLMNPAPIPLPPRLATRLPAETAAQIVGTGNAALLAEALLGFMASRQCPGHLFIETLDLVPQWAREGRVLVSGFHSPLEQQVLHSHLRRAGRAVKVLARSFAETGYRPASSEEKQALAENRLLVLSVSPAAVKRITRETALQRNQLVHALAAELHTPMPSP